MLPQISLSKRTGVTLPNDFLALLRFQLGELLGELRVRCEHRCALWRLVDYMHDVAVGVAVFFEQICDGFAGAVGIRDFEFAFGVLVYLSVLHY